ncbi:MAG: restriction endonuclease subunit S [Snowella sp.]|nr:restriction endonuclease subunit S [Snowella sp.]
MFYPLDSLGLFFQGLVVNRYLASGTTGRSLRVVQTRDLDELYVSLSLDVFSLEVPNLSRYSLQIGDVVMTVRGSSQKVSVVNGGVVGAIAGQNLAVFRPSLTPKDSPVPINPLFLAVLLRSQWFAASLSRVYRQSTATRSLNLKQLRQMEVPVPSLEVQQDLATLFLATEQFQLATLQSVVSRQRLAELTLSKVLGEAP